MKFKTLFGSILTCGLVTVSASAQMTDLASVKLVSTETADGKQILVLSTGVKTSSKLAAQKLGAGLATSAFSTAVATAKPAKAGSVATSGLAPGQIVVLGKTGTSVASTAVNLADTLVVSAPARVASTSLSANPLAATIERQVFAGDLPRDTTTLGSGLTLGTTAAATGAIVIGTNGFPAFIATAAPQSGTNPIGPNGFPQPLTNGPQAGIQPIGPDGFPIATVAPFSQTGLTRAGTPRDGSLPVTAPVTAPAATGAVGIMGARPSSNVVVSAPATTAATAIGTTSATSATSASTTASSASPR